MKNIALVTLLFVFVVASACSSATAPAGNSNTSANNSSNLPPEFQPKTITPDGKTTPGIPDPNSANISNMNKGMTATPGIPDPKTLGKTPVPQGATPTPGIPSAEELKRQMNRKLDANAVNRPGGVIREIEKRTNEAIKSVKKN